MADLAIVTACDERYAPLTKGLILSLRALGFPQAGQEICLLDIGCSDATLNWMAAHNVKVVRLKASDHIPFSIDHLPPYVAAMAFRPFIREVFRDFDVYLWIDSDTWVQQASSIHLYHQLASSGKHTIVISPLVDVTYKLHYNFKVFNHDLDRIYRAIYGEVGSELAWLAILGAGVFAMRHDSKIWNAWAAELPVVYSRDYSLVPDALHLAEQTALNRVIYIMGGAAYLDATHNYHLCAGSVYWKEGRLVTSDTGRIIGIAHLCSLSTYAEIYVKGLAFFDRGRYLSEDELSQIRALRTPRKVD
jgi:hypothetical protein